MPWRCSSVGTTPNRAPGSTFWRWNSRPTKKNALSRFRFHSVPGRMIGPPMLPPGYLKVLFGFSTPAMLFERSLAANRGCASSRTRCR
jgi:hypothetical protein